MRRSTGFALAMGSLLLPGLASASTIIDKDFVCPVGGQKFSAAMYAPLFLYGERPDGRSFGTGHGYVDAPECPKTHLVLYRDFSKTEIPLLAEAIKRPEYLAMIKTETRFYRAAWLENTIRPASPDYAWYLLMATWYVDRDASRKLRYQEQFLSVAELVPVDPSDFPTVMLRLRVLNVYRERKQFDRVIRALDALPIEALAAGLPAAGGDKVGIGDKDWERWNIVSTAQHLRVLALREDASVNPIDIVPEWMADEICYFRQPKSAFETKFCATPEVQARLAQEGFSEQDRWEYEYDGPIAGPPPPPSPPPKSGKPH